MYIYIYVCVYVCVCVHPYVLVGQALHLAHHRRFLQHSPVEKGGGGREEAGQKGHAPLRDGFELFCSTNTAKVEVANPGRVLTPTDTSTVLKCMWDTLDAATRSKYEKKAIAGGSSALTNNREVLGGGAMGSASVAIEILTSDSSEDEPLIKRVKKNEKKLRVVDDSD